MPLTMARPWRHPKTHVWYLRQRTPLDLVPRLAGRTVVLPVGEGFAETRIGSVVQVSLRTKDDKAAKTLHAVTDAALRRFWDGQRSGPKRITHKQAAALAGTLYHGFSATLGDNPGEPERWAEVDAMNQHARAGTFGMGALLIGPEARQTRAREDRWGVMADGLIAREGLNLEADGRALLVRAVQVALESVTGKLKAASEFDYSPTPDDVRFPHWTPPKAEKAPTERLPVDKLVDAWTAFQTGKLAPNTIKRYAVSLRSLAAFTKDRDAGKLDGDDIHAWAVHRRDKDGIAARVINKNDLVAISSAFKWAMGREAGRLVSSNPVKDVDALTGDAKVIRRAKTFRPDEATAILKAALAVQDDPKNPTFAFAKRWCPWLAAYSGARITELTGLTGADILDDEGHTVMAFRKTKTGIPRSVPLHPHLIEMGFLDFVRRQGPGHLFIDPRRSSKTAKTDPAEIRSRKMAQWVRDAVNLDMDVQPDHGWRHLWKTKALEVGIAERISDAITGHRVRSVARSYETPTTSMMAEAMKRFPRYDLRGQRPKTDGTS